jgi:hypothetical protein
MGGHWGTAGARAAKPSRIPVVFLATGDPLSLGLVTSLPLPGGNLTGVPAAAASADFAQAVQTLVPERLLSGNLSPCENSFSLDGQAFSSRIYGNISGGSHSQGRRRRRRRGWWFFSW